MSSLVTVTVEGSPAAAFGFVMGMLGECPHPMTECEVLDLGHHRITFDTSDSVQTSTPNTTNGPSPRQGHRIGPAAARPVRHLVAVPQPEGGAA